MGPTKTKNRQTRLAKKRTALKQKFGRPDYILDQMSMYWIALSDLASRDEHNQCLFVVRLPENFGPIAA